MEDHSLATGKQLRDERQCRRQLPSPPTACGAFTLITSHSVARDAPNAWPDAQRFKNWLEQPLFQWRKNLVVLSDDLSVMEAAPERQRRGEDRQDGDHTHY